VLEEPMMVKY